MTSIPIYRPGKEVIVPFWLFSVELEFARVELEFARVELEFARVELEFARVELEFARVELEFARVELESKLALIFERLCENRDITKKIPIERRVKILNIFSLM